MARRRAARPTNPAAATFTQHPVDGVNGEDVLTACVELCHRVGAVSYETRYSDDHEPVVWMAIAMFRTGKFEVDAGRTPQLAAWRLVERLVDGGQCLHCHRVTGVTLDVGKQLAEELVCWYQYDPELKTFRRGCEGD